MHPAHTDQQAPHVCAARSTGGSVLRTCCGRIPTLWSLPIDTRVHHVLYSTNLYQWAMPKWAGTGVLT